ncbi:MAG TPA: LptF/LptG family permease [bacterium]|jgi:lipopolysaccharide export system permease protein
MLKTPVRKIDRLILTEFIPFFIMGVAAFTMLMVAVTLMRDILNYVTNYGLSLADIGVFFILALPQVVAYTLPMAILFSALLTFGRLSDTTQITALRAGGVDFFRIIAPALYFAWFVVLFTFVLNEKVAPQSTISAKIHIQQSLIDKGIHLQEKDISYLDNEAGWLFSAATAEGNTFFDVRWLDFSSPDTVTITIAEKGEWLQDSWQFYNAEIMTVPRGSSSPDEDQSGNGKVIRVQSPEIEVNINRTPSDILSEATHRDPEEMSLDELGHLIANRDPKIITDQNLRKLKGTYYSKIAIPFASIVFTLIAAPLGLTPVRSTSSRGVGLSLLLVFGYYILTTFSIKIAESGVLTPMLAAWLPNIVFLAAGIILVARFYSKQM